MFFLLIPVCVILSGILTIYFDARGSHKSVYVLRPITMLLIILVVLLERAPVSPSYKLFIGGGLILSLGGDIFMMLQKKKFIAGLLCFLGANGFYILAFRPGPGRPPSTGVLLPFVILGLLVFRALAPFLGKMKFPVLLYIGAITAMGGLAANRFVDLGGPRAFSAFIGALFFLTSDAVFAYNRFVKPLKFAQTIILGTYFPAQLLIALSV